MLIDYDEIVREWAYRVPNGKPDFNNPYHKDKLAEVMKELNYGKSQKMTYFYH